MPHPDAPQADENPTPALTPLAQWQTLFQAKLAEGYSWLNALEAVSGEHPGLWQAATAEHARQTTQTPRGATRWRGRMARR